VKHTAPYFHDNSAKDFDEMLVQYDFFFAASFGNDIVLTAQDKEDIKAFLELL
jgi:cytochrome c peroxidase